MRHTIALGILALLAACAASRSPIPPEAARATPIPPEPARATPIPPDPARASQEVDILESVYRYQFEHYTSSATALDDVDVFFLSFAKNQDPPVELLSRFADHDPPVAPISAGDQTRYKVTHKSTGGRGIILFVKIIRWIDGDTIEAEGGYWEADRSASGHTYRAERHDERWVVVDDTMNWIS